MDETGATLGPLLIALVLFLKGSYRTGFAFLLLSSVLALGTLSIARIVFPLPSRLETGQTAPSKGFTPSYWLYMLAGAFFAGLFFLPLLLAGTGGVKRIVVVDGTSTSFGTGVASALQQSVRRVLGRYFYEITQRKPVILPVIMEV